MHGEEEAAPGRASRTIAPAEIGRFVVAMSGGVDSAVAAALLREGGHDVVGVTLHLWDASGQHQVGRCCAPEDRDDARRVCDHLGVAHFVMDERVEFRRHVVEPFVRDYRSGETPSPCVHCNRGVKVARLLAFADEIGASHVATGHYARLEPGSAGAEPRLLRGIDRDKDQSYFLYGLPVGARSRLLFPLGGMTKGAVREAAVRLGLPNAAKGESQELCFVPDGDIAGFIRREAGPEQPGPIRTEDGRIVGDHCGVSAFTVGQRRGLGIGGGPARYVVRILADTAEVVVGPIEALGDDRVIVPRCEWQGPPPNEGFRATVRVRYRHQPAAAFIEPHRGGFVARFDEAQRAITPGQAAVVYRGDEVLGGGIIAHTPEESASPATQPRS